MDVTTPHAVAAVDRARRGITDRLTGLGIDDEQAAATATWIVDTLLADRELIAAAAGRTTPTPPPWRERRRVDREVNARGLAACRAALAKVTSTDEEGGRG